MASSLPRLTLQVQFAGRQRRGVPHARSLRAWANAAYDSHRARGRRSKAAVTVRVVGAAESRRLNRAWRGKDKPTNVLSFPAGEVMDFSTDELLLGDLVICSPVVAREAREQRKPLQSHWAHMVVHGVLHLLGYDHENDRDAELMESRESAVLRRFGMADPYGEHHE